MSSFGDLSGLVWIPVCPGACEEEGCLDLVRVQDFQEVGQLQTVAGGTEVKESRESDLSTLVTGSSIPVALALTETISGR